MPKTSSMIKTLPVYIQQLVNVSLMYNQFEITKILNNYNYFSASESKEFAINRNSHHPESVELLVANGQVELPEESSELVFANLTIRVLLHRPESLKKTKVICYLTVSTIGT